jgi:microsomal dipeptidase-like Zn-dependent dipeptidase
MKVRNILLAFILILTAIYVAVVQIVSDRIEKSKNKVKFNPPYKTSKEALVLYKSLDFIADLHCDALLWNRNLTKKSDFGHVDFPRMQEANVALQTFTIVTKSPKGQGFRGTRSDAFDNVTYLNIVQGRPLSNWFSLINRAVYQSNKLHKFGKRYENKFEIIKSSGDFEKFLRRRKSDKSIISGFLGVEGAHCLEGDLGNLDKLYEAGIRMIGPTHFFDNELGGSAHGISGEGLTDFGMKVIDRMNELGIIIDLSHLSAKMIDDVLSRTNAPVLVSHTGVNGTYDSPRNLSDDQLKKIAANGGLIGITFFKGAIPEVGVKGIVDAMKYVRDFVGAQHVALGSDYDGDVTAPFDITGFPLIVEEMLLQDFSENEIRAIMGENVKKFLLKNLK